MKLNDFIQLMNLEYRLYTISMSTMDLSGLMYS